jgi:Holliday junction resolvasome RuvABC DNA-binding subunit
MEAKREAARLAAAEARARAAVARAEAEEKRAAAAERERVERAAAREAQARQLEAEQDPDRSVVPWLRQLGFTLDEARRAAAFCESRPYASLEERIRDAIRHVSPQYRPVAPFAATAV